MVKMNMEICNGYIDGTIPHSVFMKEYQRVYGKNVSNPIEKSSDELLRKAVDENDNESYMELRRRDEARTSEIKKASYDELQQVQDEFTRLLSQTIRKSNETKEMVANRVWTMESSNGEILYDRYQRAMRNITV